MTMTPFGLRKKRCSFLRNASDVSLAGRPAKSVPKWNSPSMPQSGQLWALSDGQQSSIWTHSLHVMPQASACRLR